MKKHNVDSKGKIDSKSSNEGPSHFGALNLEEEKIIDWLEKIEFRKKRIGGVDEQDVWKKIHELNKMYQAALRAERIRYDALLEKEKVKYESESYRDQARKGSSSYE